MKSFNHEGHEAREEHEEDPFSPKRMRNASPLSPEAERVMHATIGCAIAVHRALGPGFLESIYRKAMSIELESLQIAYERERSIDVTYRGIPIPGQRIDLIVGGLIVASASSKTACGESSCDQDPSCSSPLRALRGESPVNGARREDHEGW